MPGALSSSAALARCSWRGKMHRERLHSPGVGGPWVLSRVLPNAPPPPPKKHPGWVKLWWARSCRCPAQRGSAGCCCGAPLGSSPACGVSPKKPESDGALSASFNRLCRDRGAHPRRRRRGGRATPPSSRRAKAAWCCPQGCHHFLS